MIEHTEKDCGLAKPALRHARRLRSLRRQDGQAMVELALVLPILLAIVVGIFDFGTAFNHENSLRFLANQAARYAEVNGCAPCQGGQTIAQYVPTTADTSALQNDAQISYCLPNGSDGSKGSALRVEASYLNNWLPFMQHLGLPATSTLSATVTVRLLAQSDGSLYPAPAALASC